MIPLRDTNPTEIRPVVTVTLIVINSLIFIFQFFIGEANQGLVYRLGAIPWEIVHFRNLYHSPGLPPFINLFTAMFLHGGFLHLIGNMLYLWIFGNNIEDVMGHGRFIVFYLLTGVIASGGHILADPLSEIPMIGASGAISGVLGAYLLLFPKARVLTLIPLGYVFFTKELPAVFVLGFWFVLQLFNGILGSAGGGGVAWFAHIGGFMAGFILIKLFQKARPRRPAPAPNLDDLDKPWNY